MRLLCRLVAMTLLIAPALSPASAHASASFAFLPDPTPPSLPAGSNLVAVADLTGAGIPDLVIVNGEANAVGVMLGNGAGGFAAPSWYPAAGHPAFVSIADFNNDGHPDLLVPVETIPPPTPYPNPLPDKVQILFGDGHGSFTVGPIIKLPETGPVYVADLTGNGNQDIVVAPDGCWGRGNSNTYYLLLGDGHGNLTSGPVYRSPRSGGCRSFVGDFTGGGRDDLLTQPDSPGEEAAIVVLPGQAGGGFGAPIVTPTPQLASHLAFVSAVGDLESDGTLDLVVRVPQEPMGRVVVFKGNGAGAFSEAGAYASEQPGTFEFQLALGTFAGTGHVDVATIASQVSVLANNGLGAFSPAFTTPRSGAFNSVFVADINHDGRPDLVLGWQSEVHIFLDEPLVAATVTAPVLQRARESATRWREGSRFAHISRTHEPPIGTTFSFLLTEQAGVTFAFTHQVGGRAGRHECVAQTNKNRHRSTCRRTTTAGTLRFTGHPGSNSVMFQGRLTRSRKLKPGRYTLIITATNSARASKPQALSFTIVR
jgi:hypothetical protein